jgi:hypothetical protein
MRGGLSTGLYDVRREDGSTIALAADFGVADALRSLPEAEGVFWIALDEAPARLDTIRLGRTREEK